MTNHVICVGSGHLAIQVARRLREKKYEVVRVSSEVEGLPGKQLEHSVLDHLRGVFRDAGIAGARAIFLVHEEDSRNLELTLVALSLNQRVPTIVALFNE